MLSPNDPVRRIGDTLYAEIHTLFAEELAGIPSPAGPTPIDLSIIRALKLIGDTLYEQYHDEDFADLYHTEGQPALSPVLLAFVLICQALNDLSDRDALFNVAFNTAWQHALHLPLSYPGFDHTVLSAFHTRILTHDAEGRIFTAVLAQLKQLGFFKHKGIQHTDSIGILSHHRRMKRIELCIETMRGCIKHLLHHAPEWTRATLPTEWEERYAKHCKSERLSEEERQALAMVVGDDGQWLLERLEQDDAADLHELRAVATLRDVWAVHYERGGSHAIEMPYDPDARWATNRSTDWVGYKLHVAETDDQAMPHLITDSALTPAPPHDMTALPAIRERPQHTDTLRLPPASFQPSEGDTTCHLYGGGPLAHSGVGSPLGVHGVSRQEAMRKAHQRTCERTSTVWRKCAKGISRPLGRHNQARASATVTLERTSYTAVPVSGAVTTGDGDGRRECVQPATDCCHAVWYSNALSNRQGRQTSAIQPWRAWRRGGAIPASRVCPG